MLVRRILLDVTLNMLDAGAWYVACINNLCSVVVHVRIVSDRNIENGTE